MHSLSSLFSVQVLSSEEAANRTSTSRANGSLFDGSYLSLPATRVHRGGGSGGGRTATTHSQSSNAATLSCAGEISPTDGPIQQLRTQKSRESEGQHRCGPCRGQDSGARIENGHHDTSNQHECERYSLYHFSYHIIVLVLL